MEEEITLIENVRDKKDSQSLLMLLEIYNSMIYSIINSYDLNCGDYLVAKEDLFQEGTIGLYDACNAYKNTGLAKFSTFAYVVIKRRIAKAYYRMQMPYQKEGVSFDKLEIIDHFSKIGYQVADNELKYGEQKEKLSKCEFLTDEDRKILKMRMENYSYKEIAAVLNITPKRVDNRISKIKKAIKNNKID